MRLWAGTVCAVAACSTTNITDVTVNLDGGAVDATVSVSFEAGLVDDAGWSGDADAWTDAADAGADVAAVGSDAADAAPADPGWCGLGPPDSAPTSGGACAAKQQGSNPYDCTRCTAEAYSFWCPAGERPAEAHDCYENWDPNYGANVSCCAQPACVRATFLDYYCDQDGGAATPRGFSCSKAADGGLAATSEAGCIPWGVRPPDQDPDWRLCCP